MSLPQVDALRVLHDRAYAASLTDAHWRALASDQAWLELTSEMPELALPAMERLGRLPVAQTSAGQGGAQTQLTTPGGPGPFAVIGTAVPRVQGNAIVTGQGRYSQHTILPGTLFLRALGSPHPHAKIKAINSKPAEDLPGVKLVLHRFNVPDEYKQMRIGGGPPFRNAFPDEVFEVGAPVAVVVAESERTADEAARLIEVQYEPLPAMLDFLEGAKSSAAKQWDNKLDGTITNADKPFVRGDPARGFAEAEVTVQAATSRSTEQHVALELSTSTAWWENDRLNILGTTRHVHGTRAVLAQAFGLPQNKVRAVQPGLIGSSYGSHRNADLPELHAAVAAKLTGRPVRTMSTRTEDFVNRTHRGRMYNEGKLGVKRDGTMTAGEFKIVADVGAARSTAASGSWIGLQSTYVIPNLRLEAVDVFTNRYKTNSLRCVSHPNGTWAIEGLVDRAAYQIGMSPLDIRLKNLNLVGNPDSKKPFSNPGLKDCLEQAAATMGYQQKWHAPKAKEVRPGVFHGIGLAVHSCSHGAGGNPATGAVIVNPDGSVNVISGAAEVGPGERTLMAMIAAEALAVPITSVSIAYEVDTDISPDTGVTAGSRQTNSGGWGVYQASLDARAQILSWAAQKLAADAKAKNETFSVKPEEMEIRQGAVVVKSDPTRKLALGDVVSFATSPIIGRGAVVYDAKWERLAFAAHSAEVEVDTVTGSVRVTKYVAAHDVGRALNPFAVQQQIEGGVIMGMGAALTEAMLVDGSTGIPLNPNMLDYRALTMGDVPRKIDVVLVEKPKEYGVFGAHGIGEPPIALAGPVIANAIYNAVGVWLTDLPMSRQRVLAALKGA